MLETLRARVSHLREPLCQRALGLAREHLDRAFELAREPARSVLARGLRDGGELLCRFVAVGRRRARDDALQVLDLAARDILEAGADPLHGLGLFPFDVLGQLALAPAHPLFELVERAPPLDAVRIDLGLRRRHRVAERLVQLVPHPHERGPLVLALGRETVGVGGEPHLDLGEKLLLPRRQLGDPELRALGRAVEILCPCCESLLHLRLRARQRLGE